MFRNVLSRLVLPVIPAAALLIASGPALAQHGGHGGGGFHAGGVHAGAYHGGFGSYHSAYHPYYGHYAYPYYFGYGAFPSLGYGYYPSYDSPAYPLYDGGSYSYFPSTGSDGTAVPSGTSATTVPAGSTAHITVQLPNNADLWFNGTQMTGTGPVREFNTPALTVGQNYSYQVRARWTDNNITIDRKQAVMFAAGDSLEILFAAQPGSAETTASR